MRLRHLEQEPADERRYDSSTLPKVTALATQLQKRRQETLTAGEIESIGAEVGLDPAVVRQALAQLSTEKPAAVATPWITPEMGRKIIACWWAAGWFLIILFDHLGSADLGVWLYVIPGILMSILLPKTPRRQRHRWREWEDTTEEVPAATPLSRTDLLEVLFALQRQLEGQKQRRAFLSVDVVDSSTMKQNAPELAVEYSFGKFRTWVEGVVRQNGGEMQSAAGDGVMCVFPAETGAVRAARQLQEGIAPFNAEQNRLPAPFHIRCGVSAGEVAIEPGIPLGHVHSPVIDRAAALQKRAQPGDILVGSEVTAAALLELGGAAPLTDPATGEAAFSWRAGKGQ